MTPEKRGYNPELDAMPDHGKNPVEHVPGEHQIGAEGHTASPEAEQAEQAAMKIQAEVEKFQSLEDDEKEAL